MTRPSPILAHNLLLQGELLRVARGLKRSGIDFISIKGVVLLHRIHGRLDVRAVSDNDLLVRPSDVGRALRTFTELGYRPHRQADLEDALAADAKYVLVRHHLGRALWLDIHVSPLVPTIHRGPVERFWDQTESFVLDGTSLRVLSPEATLLHLVAHAEQHRFCEPRILLDVAAAFNAWQGTRLCDERLLGLAARWRLEHALDYALGSASRLGLLRAAPPYIGSGRARRLTRLLRPEHLLVPAQPYSVEGYRRSLLVLLLRDPDRALAQLKKDFLPPLSKLAVIYDHKESPWLYSYYATRPLRPLARLLGWRPRAESKERGRSRP